MGCSVNASSNDTLKVITHGIFPPLCSIDTSGKVVGIDADLVQIIASEMGYKKVQFDVADHTALFAAVQSGAYDFATCLSPTPERLQMVDFTDPYMMTSLFFITRSDDTSLDGLTQQQIETAVSGKTVGCVFGSFDYDYISAVSGAIPVNYDNLSLEIIALNNHQVDYILWEFNTTSSGLIMRTYVFDKNSGIKLIETPVAASPSEIIVKKGNTQLLASLNEIIAEVKSDGRLDAIVAKYL